MSPETPLIAQEFGAVYTKVATIGCAAARNGGMRRATGDFIAFIDDDDIWLPENIHAHLAVFDAQPELEAVFGQVVVTDQHLNPIMAPYPEDPGTGDRLIRTMLTGYYPQVGGTVVRASVVREIGLFDETLIGDQDWDWHLRLARRRKVGFTPTPGELFRQRPPGTFDKLRMTRLRYARLVYMRHAVPEWRVLGGPLGFMHGYTRSIRQYFDYYVDAAVSRARTGERKGAWSAIFSAFRVFPARTLYHLVMKPRLRGAAIGALLPRGAK